MVYRGHISFLFLKNLTTYGEQQPLLWKGQMQYFPNEQSPYILRHSWGWSTRISQGRNIVELPTNSGVSAGEILSPSDKNEKNRPTEISNLLKDYCFLMPDV